MYDFVVPPKLFEVGCLGSTAQELLRVPGFWPMSVLYEWQDACLNAWRFYSRMYGEIFYIPSSPHWTRIGHLTSADKHVFLLEKEWGGGRKERERESVWCDKCMKALISNFVLQKVKCYIYFIWNVWLEPGLLCIYEAWNMHSNTFHKILKYTL